ncbi:hypothetical protein ACSBR1_038147 [Camellia fascicularis]
MKRNWRKREHLNGTLRGYLKGDHNIVQFFTHFNWIIIDKQYEEISAIYDSRQKLPRMKLKIKCVIGLYGNNEEYIVEGRVEVTGLRGEKKLSRNTLYFHAIKALDRMNVMEIPERYILGQWRLDAKDCQVEKENVIADENDPKLLILARYRDFCPRMVKLVTQASVHKPTYQLVDEGIKELCVKVNNMMKGVVNFGTKELDVDDPNFAQVKGIKKKDVGNKGRGRLKPWHEMMNKKTKVISQPTCLSKIFTYVLLKFQMTCIYFYKLCKTIGQSINTINVQNSSSSQPQTTLY